MVSHAITKKNSLKNRYIMRIKHYTLIVAFLAISMGIPLVQGCSDPFDEYGNGGTEMPVRDGWTSVSMSVEGLGLRNSLTRSLTPEGENSTAAERIRVLVFDKDNKFSYEAKVLSYIPSGDPADKKGKGTMTLLAKNTPSGDTSTFVMLANVTRSANTDADGLAGKTREEVMQLFTFSMPDKGGMERRGVADVGCLGPGQGGTQCRCRSQTWNCLSGPCRSTCGRGA